MTRHIFYVSIFRRTTVPFQETEIITLLYFTADTAFRIQNGNNDGMMRRSKINNTYHTTSVHYPHFTAHTVCRTFIYSNIIIGMSNAIIDNTRLEDVSTASLRALASASVMSRSASASPKILDVIFSILILFSAFPSVFRHSDIRSVSLYRYSQPDQYGNQQREDRVGFYHRGINDTFYHLIRSFGCQLQRRRGRLALRDT